MNDSKWILKLYSKDRGLIKPILKKTKEYYICRYTIPMLKSNDVLQISFYSKDNFKTINKIENYDYKRKRSLVIDVGNKVIPETLWKKVKDIKTKSNLMKLFLKVKNNISENALLEDTNKVKLFFKIFFVELLRNPYGILILFFLILSLTKGIRNFLMKKYVDKTESKVDEEIFKYQTGNEKEFDVYSGLIYNIKIILDTNSINGLLVTGPPGTGKTYVVRRTLYFSNIPYNILKGTAIDEWTVYGMLYRNRNKVLVLDDFDVKWTENLVGILKAATDTSKKRMIYFPRISATSDVNNSEVSELPQQFVYTGKLIILTNKNLRDIPDAVRSRMPNFDVRFDIKKMFEVLQKMLKFLRNDIPMETKQEVLDFLLVLHKKGKLKYLDFRTMEIALDLRMVYPDKWKQVLVSIVR